MNLNDWFEYKDGRLYWKKDRAGKIKAGEPLKFYISQSGYKRAGVLGKQRLVHRMVWELLNGPIDSHTILDHMNGDRQDNRIENLRVASPSENMANSKHRQRQLWRNVYQNSNNTWYAMVRHAMGREYLGSFSDARDAAQAVNYCLRRVHGPFAKLNLAVEDIEVWL